MSKRENRGKTLAVIPARSGSKRVKDKNIKNFCNKPLMAWSIQAGLAVESIDTVVVSTDSAQYASVAREYGACVPFLRPPEISTDSSSTFAVLENTIEYYKIQGESFDTIVVLQPTSPLRQARHINEALEVFFAQKASAVISVCACEHPPMWSNTLPSDHSMEHFLPKSLQNTRSQDLPTHYRLNGAIFIANIPQLLAHKSFFMPSSYAYVMESAYSSDIDTPLEFEVAEFIAKKTGIYE